MGEQKKSKKVVRAGRVASPLDISETRWENHHQLFNHLIKAGPTMHGTPGAPKPKKGGK